MRWDDVGLLWQDIKEEKVTKPPKPKRVAPDPVWLRDDYLPFLDEARTATFDLMSDAELIAARAEGVPLVWDTEFYPNYALVGFQNIKTKKQLIFEKQHGGWIDIPKLRWVLQNFLLVGFNDRNFDVPMAAAVLAEWNTEALYHKGVELLIFGGPSGMGMRPREFYSFHKLAPLHVNNIDLIELTPLSPSLKVCAGRMHAPLMQDLPFPPGKELTPDQIDILRWYWSNDINNTRLLYEKHVPAIELRKILTDEYGVDVRSKSDPQIAESVIRTEIQRMTGRKWLERATIEPGRKFRFVAPNYVQFKTSTLQWVKQFVETVNFVVGDGGEPLMPKELDNVTIPINKSVYKIGMGGLHSQEKCVIHISDEHFELSDNDVTSYYPALIIQQGMYPPNIGPAFLQVFKRIVDRRVKAKRDGDKGTAETLKIVANGTFGKTGERGGHSVVYYPEMMIQVTLSGQLSLLLLIESLELNGIEVVSANTDGIMIKCPRDKIELKKALIAEWEAQTGLGMESKGYKAIYSRDINNYIALYEKPDEKEKGAWKYAKAVGAYRKTIDVYPLKWNPTYEICNEAVIEYLATGKPIEQSIAECRDIRKFIEARLVRGGACKDGEYLGKAIRWYYAKGVEGEIINAKNGHSVPRSQGARPCMRLPEELPEDLDLDRYVAMAYGILEDFNPKESASSKKQQKAA